MIFTPPQVATRWRCKPQPVRDLLEAGRLAGFRVGAKHWRITLAAVEAFERGERQPAPAPKPTRRRRAVIQQITGPF